MRLGFAVAAAVAVVLVTATACGEADRTPAPETTHPSSTGQQLATAESAAPPPVLDVSVQAQQRIGAKRAQEAWQTLAGWIQATGYRPDLIATAKPEPAQLDPITAQMTPDGADAFRDEVAAAENDRAHLDNVETLTAVGVATPDGTLVPAADMVTARALTGARAALDDEGNLTIGVTSLANIHFVSDDETRRFHSTFTRSTTYTLVEQGGRWLVDTWQGSYTTTNPIAD